MQSHKKRLSVSFDHVVIKPSLFSATMKIKHTVLASRYIFFQQLIHFNSQET